MKNRDIVSPIYRVLGILLIATAMTGCKPEPEGELGTPFSKKEGLIATAWEIEQVMIVDGADPAKSERDFSAYYLGGNDRLTLEFAGDGTFSITPGEGLNFLPESGEWQFDHAQYPTQILLNPAGDTQILNLESPTRIVDDRLRVRFDKYTCTLDETLTAVYSYSLIFKRVN